MLFIRIKMLQISLCNQFAVSNVANFIESEAMAWHLRLNVLFSHQDVLVLIRKFRSKNVINLNKIGIRLRTTEFRRDCNSISFGITLALQLWIQRLLFSDQQTWNHSSHSGNHFPQKFSITDIVADDKAIILLLTKWTAEQKCNISIQIECNNKNCFKNFSFNLYMDRIFAPIKCTQPFKYLFPSVSTILWIAIANSTIRRLTFAKHSPLGSSHLRLYYCSQRTSAALAELKVI